jgi:nitrous oxide reductase accessory protein NosL
MKNAEGSVMRAVSWMITICFLLAVPAAVMAQPDIEQHPSCPYCGMDRAKFAHSRMLINYKGGSSVGTCSLHCVVIDQALKIDLMPAQVLVGDFKSKKLIDAERAYWVMGGDKMGVMTKRAKWAFENLKDAQDYIQAHGGKLVTYEDAVKGAFEDMYQDIQMIRKKRQMKRKKKAE